MGEANQTIDRPERRCEASPDKNAFVRLVGALRPLGLLVVIVACASGCGTDATAISTAPSTSVPPTMFVSTTTTVPEPGLSRSATTTLPPPATTFAPDPAAITCAASAWNISLESGGVSEYTGGNTSIVTLVNTSSQTCVLNGYLTPTIEGGDGQAFPFKISHGGSQAASPAPPQRVEVHAGQAAYAVFDKFRCDLPGARKPASVSVTLPDSREPIRVTVGGSAWPGYLAYCGDGDPGSSLGVTAIVANLADAFRTLH